jgi:hypothetical protein
VIVLCSVTGTSDERLIASLFRLENLPERARPGIERKRALAACVDRSRWCWPSAQHCRPPS